MQLRIPIFTTLLPHVVANDCFIPVTSYGTNAIPLGPKFATPQTLFDGRDALQDLASRETFDELDNRGRTRARHGLYEKMDMIVVGTNFSQDDRIPFRDVSADLFQHSVDFRVKDNAAILRRTHDMVKQGRNIVSFMSIVAHTSDNNTREKAEASFEESDPRD
jgi:hypothetical protein